MDKAALETLLTGMVKSNATTLHLVAGHTPWVRTATKLVPCSGPELTNELPGVFRGASAPFRGGVVARGRPDTRRDATRHLHPARSSSPPPVGTSCSWHATLPA